MSPASRSSMVRFAHGVPRFSSFWPSQAKHLPPAPATRGSIR